MKIVINDGKFKYLEKYLKDQIKKLNNIFKIKLDIVSLDFIDDRKEFANILNIEHLPKWLVARTKNKKIYILNPYINKSKKYNINNFKKVILHELVHVYYNSIIFSGKPYWINEGLAYILSNQKYKKIKYLKTKLKALNYVDTFDENIYKYGPNLMEHIIKEKGFNFVINKIKNKDFKII